MYPKPNDYYPPPPPTIITPPPSAPFYPQPPPPPLGMHPHGPVPWSTGLCDCTDDCGNCCMTCFCPCVTFGRVAEIVDRGSTSCGAAGALYTVLEWFTCCHCVYSCFNRKKMRAQYSLAATPCNDFCIHCCCEPCALCQEYRELKNRGFDMTVGWQMNTARQAVLMTAPPPFTGGMMR